VDDGLRAGAVERQLSRAARRILAGARIPVVLVGGLLGVLSAPAGDRVPTVVAVLAVLAWSVVYSSQLWRKPRGWLVWADLGVLMAACLSQPWTVPSVATANGQGWVITMVSVAVVIHQWHTKTLPGAVTTLLLTATYLIGAWWAAPAFWAGAVAIGAWTPIQATLSRRVVSLLLRGAQAADAQQAQAEAARQKAAVAEAVRADERAHTSMLHDTAATTLLMVGLGEVPSGQLWLREQARQDLAALDGSADSAFADGNLMPRLLHVIRTGRVAVDLSAPDAIPLPPDVTTALCGAVKEALNNVARHAGTENATATVTDDDGRIAVEIADQGRGFAAAAVPRWRRGVANSIIDRMAAVGGRAVIDSAPGAGTTVRLEWDRV
jgi:signal transduction histidine kinase